MSHGAGYGRLGVGSWRWKVAGVAGSIHINSSVLFCFMFHFFMVHVSYFKNISGINNVGSLMKMFDRTAGWIKRVID
jgi:hypothetical protein